MAMPLKESDIRKQIQDYLRWKGWFVYYNLQGLGSYPGLSDLVAMKDGRTIHLEIKTPRGKQKANQVTFQENVESAGGTYKVARCLEDVMNL